MRNTDVLKKFGENLDQIDRLNEYEFEDFYWIHTTFILIWIPKMIKSN
jgi:hypothetical protein